MKVFCDLADKLPEGVGVLIENDRHRRRLWGAARACAPDI